MKYKGIKEIGRELGRIYALSIKGSGFFNDIDLIIPVPLHPLKMRSRGFNQSHLIAEGISEVTGIKVDATSLSRISLTGTQTKKSRYDRWINVEGIFSINNHDKLKGRHVLIVDDVITTGSTIESCADEILKVEGAKVSVLALAFSITG